MILYRFNLTAQKLNMLMSQEKALSKVIYRNPIRCELMFNDQITDQVMNYSCREIELCSVRHASEEIKKQVNRAAGISGYLRDIIRRNTETNSNHHIRKE